MVKWVYRLATSEFVSGGTLDPSFNVLTENVVTLLRDPDRRLERYDGSLSSKIRPATAQEIADYDEAKLDEEASAATNGVSPAFTALRQWVLEQINVLRAIVVPALPALTEAAQLADLKAKYKAEKVK